MNSTELNEIKKYQREFKRLFNKELVIDFVAMKGVPKVTERTLVLKFDTIEADKILSKLCKKHKADINIILEKKKRLAFRFPNEVKVVTDYVKECVNMNWGYKEIMLHINRDRSDIYYYLKKQK